jgi:protein-tyrosine-phosphatase
MAVVVLVEQAELKVHLVQRVQAVHRELLVQVALVVVVERAAHQELLEVVEQAERKVHRVQQVQAAHRELLEHQEQAVQLELDMVM